MQNINKTVVSGNIGTAVKRTDTFVTFSVCVNNRGKDEGGNWVDVPNWFNCTFGGKRAATLFDKGMLAKGVKVTVLGHLVADAYEKNGEKRTAVKIAVENIEFMSGRRAASAESPAQEPQHAPAPSAYNDEDIPF